MEKIKGKIKKNPWSKVKMRTEPDCISDITQATLIGKLSAL